MIVQHGAQFILLHKSIVFLLIIHSASFIWIEISTSHLIVTHSAHTTIHCSNIQYNILHDSFNYEAAVCGGIPIIHSLHSDFLADRITKIRGIMNGTVSTCACACVCECECVCAPLFTSPFHSTQLYFIQPSHTLTVSSFLILTAFSPDSQSLSFSLVQTNYMLCKMEDEGAAYGDALKGTYRQCNA